jgi:murein DD-endopeptidase MepM/ murein hydrolase activator NlpD
LRISYFFDVCQKIGTVATFQPTSKFQFRALALCLALTGSLLPVSSFAKDAKPAVANSVSPLPRELRVPGGVALIDVGATSAPRPRAVSNGANVWVAQRNDRWIAAVGIALSAIPGEHRIEVSSPANGAISATEAQQFTYVVKQKRYPTQPLKLDRAMVEPPPEVLARIERESAHLKTVRNQWRENEATSARFVLPSKGPLSSRFGLQRVLNGKPRSPHAGLDVAAPAGTPIHAPGDGIVIDTGDYYFCGKTVFIDHGYGLITLYCHLSEIIAKPGDIVKQGDRIGLIGSTGRSTGPHLHWTVYLNGVAVEPELFVDLQRAEKR